MRARLAVALLVLSLACGCAAGLAAPAALAAGSSGAGASQPGFNLSSAGQQSLVTTTTPASSSSSSSSSGGFSGLDGLLTALIGVLVLSGIAFFVWRDSRMHAARVGHGSQNDSIFGERAHAGSKAPRKPRKLTPAERKRRKRGRAR